MHREHYTFQDIITLNDKDWEKAYFMLQDFQDKGLLKKVIRGPEDIIYIPSRPIHDFEFIFDRVFSVPDRESEPIRIKRNRLKDNY